MQRDWALEAGDIDGVAAVARRAELWHRAPEEWELERPASRSPSQGFREIRVATSLGMIDVVASPFVSNGQCYLVGRQAYIDPRSWATLNSDMAAGHPGEVGIRIVRLTNEAAAQGLRPPHLGR